MQKMNPLIIVFCISLFQSTHGSVQTPPSDGNKSLLNSISWVYIAVPALTVASSFCGYKWWKNQRAVTQDDEILKAAHRIPIIKATLVLSIINKKKDKEAIRELQQINAGFHLSRVNTNPKPRQSLLLKDEMREDAEIEKLYNDNFNAHEKSESENSEQHSKCTTDYRTVFSNGFDLLPIHQRIIQRQQDLSDRRTIRNISATGTILGLGGAITLSVLKALGKI